MFFKKKSFVPIDVENDYWVFDEKSWDIIYFQLNLTYDKQCQMMKLFNHKTFDFRRNLNRKPTEKDYYNNIKNMLQYVGDGTVGDISTKTIYTFVVDDDLCKISSDDENAACEELKNGDLLITMYKKWNKKDKSYLETSKYKVKCGDWKRKDISQFYRIDCKSYDNVIENAKYMIEQYEKAKNIL